MGRPVKSTYFGKPTGKQALIAYTVSSSGKIQPIIKEAGEGYNSKFKLELKAKDEEGEDVLAELSVSVKDGAVSEVSVAQTGEFPANKKHTALDGIPAPVSGGGVIVGKGVIDEKIGVEDVFIIKQRGQRKYAIGAVADETRTGVGSLVEKAESLGDFEVSAGDAKVHTIQQYQVKTFGGEIKPISDIL